MRRQSASATSRPPIVVLCGSTRYWEKFAEATVYETAAGRIVLAPGCNLKEPHPLWADPAQADRLKRVLGDLHLRKIDLADEVLIVVNVRPSSPARGARGHLPSGPALCIDRSLSPLRVKSEGTSEFVSLLLAA